jgi:hypothetical protein
MEPDKRYFEGKGLFRLVRDGLESEQEADRVQDDVKSGKYGKSTVCRTTWHNDDDGTTPIPGSFAVYQRIMHDRDVASSEEEETRSNRSQREQRELKAQSNMLDAINTKLNITIATLIGVVMAGIGGWLYYVIELPKNEVWIALLLAGLGIMAAMWLHCECRDHYCC